MFGEFDRILRVSMIGRKIIVRTLSVFMRFLCRIFFHSPSQVLGSQCRYIPYEAIGGTKTEPSALKSEVASIIKTFGEGEEKV
jgi:hypothetical protein